VRAITRGTALTMLATAAALVLGAAPALASPGDDATVQTGTFTLDFNNDGGTTAFCDQGTTATGGGFGTVTPPPVNAAINVSAPVDATELPSHTRTGSRAANWYSWAYSGIPASTDMKALAVCSGSSDGRLVVASFKVPSSKTRTKTVSCPGHQRALGGGLGIASQPISGVYEAGSGPLSESNTVAGTVTGSTPVAWRVAAYNGFRVTRKFQALVVCSKTARPRIVASTTPLMPNEDVELASNCPGAERAIGGGVLQLGKPSVSLQISENAPVGVAGTIAGTTDGSVPVSWVGDVYNRLSTTRSFTTFAVCD
jgi:hypothetical protein